MHHDSQYMMQRIESLENQLAKLISLIEENNQLIKSMEQQQNQVCAPAGGSVIVRISFFQTKKHTLYNKVCFFVIFFFDEILV
ncbi:hypothetical protein COJ18_20630 [Bacillus cereus]|uniref:hypothetical protein n=2 Tax=Bacillus cereus TaxID=1396 RepID=UPI000BF5E63E|nr:hypothetical protein [Bacillus cereus]PFK32714.1 hypothetical protein COJ18_20630 [Bacillus cereus]PFR20215.1 hypothetical protein COK23_13300 [Bacillus cereus]